MNDSIYKIENSVIIYLPSDIHIILDGIRESFLFLNGLEELNIFYEGIEQQDFTKFSEGVSLLRIKLQEIENELHTNGKDDGLSSFTDDNQLKELFKRFILLKEKVDEFQVEILHQLIGVAFALLTKITKNKKYLDPYLAQIYSSLAIKSAFLHSNFEDNKKTYFLLIGYKEKFDESKDPYESYFHVGVIDYSFRLERERIRFQHIYDQLLKLIFSIPEIDNKKNIDRLISKQYLLNKHMVILTYVIGAFTFVMMVISFIQLSLHRS